MPMTRRRRSPAHAARLPVWERLVITLVLLVMAGADVAAVVALSDQHQPASQRVATRSVSPRPARHRAASGGGSTAATGSPTRLKQPPAAGTQPKPVPTPAPAGPASPSAQGPAIAPTPEPPSARDMPRTQIASLRASH